MSNKVRLGEQLTTTSVTVDIGQAGDDGSRRTQLVSFIHEADYSGNCGIVVRDFPDRSFALPCEALLRFAAEVVRKSRIEKLQQMHYLDILTGGR